MFKKATKEKSKLRLALFGPSGSGKTFTALRIGKGIGGNIAVIDSERGSSSKYSDRFEFDVCDLEDKSIEGYITAINFAAGENYPVLIVDSISHGWQELLAKIDKLAATKFKGNSWGAWSEGTPIQKRMIDCILNYPGHIITTMRSKTEWAISTGANGKSKPERLGMAPEQGKGIEYEFDLLMEMNLDHDGHVLKDRTGKYQDKVIPMPGEEFGNALAKWLDEGISIVDEIEKLVAGCQTEDDWKNVKTTCKEKGFLTQEGVNHLKLKFSEWDQENSGDKSVGENEQGDLPFDEPTNNKGKMK